MTTKSELDERKGRDPTLNAAFDQGRTAARNGISKEDAPHGEGSDELKEWQRGYRFETDGQPDSVTTESHGHAQSPKPAASKPSESKPADNANERPKAAGQVATMSDAKKA